ncbi:hypothetical protein C8Q80DRAFT_263515 [Daedaleopsis nitida]|nr:hypothetical protein C8Q80DRAFT_263515 [Daedaleopsis nitida]
MSQVCKTLNVAIRESVALRYQIELEVEGLLDGPKGGLCTADRLNRLVDRRNRWLRLDWSQVLPIPASKIIPEIPLPYELQGGTFFSFTSNGGAPVMNETRLPSHADPLPLYTTTGSEAQYIDITTDPSQDLMVLIDIQGRIHARSLTTHAAHPSAEQPILRPNGMFEPRGSGVYIAHNLVALLEWRDHIGLTIWNWKTGSAILHGYGDDLPYLVTGFVWISPSAFLLANVDGNEFLLFSLSAIDCASPAAPCTFADLAPRARLQLPQIDDGWHMSCFLLESTPILASVPAGSPFAVSTESHIIVFTTQYATTHHLAHSGRYVGFVHKWALMHYMADSSGATRNVEWGEWGPANTRIIPNRFSRAVYARYVHGQRVVFPARRHSYNAILLDFNVHPKRLASARRAGAEGDGCFELVQEPNVIRNDPVDEELLLGWLALVKVHPFVDDVETRLPYVTASALLGPKDGRAQDYMIDDERLIHLIPPVDDFKPSATSGDFGNGSVRVYTF